jgi:hypothetical protein
MITTQDREIDGMQWQVSQLPGMRGLKMFNKLGRILGPAMGKALAAGMDSKKGEINAVALSEAIAVLFDRLSEAEIESITRELLATAVVDGKPLFPGAFDLLMQGRTMTVLKALLFAFEVNYGSFFGALRGRVLAEVAKASASTSPTASGTAGPSGVSG